MEIKGISVIKTPVEAKGSKGNSQDISLSIQNQTPPQIKDQDVRPREKTALFPEEQASLDKNSPLEQKLIEKINQILYSFNKALKIDIDEDLHIPVYKIIDLKTQEVLKQIPLEEILKLKKAIAEILAKEGYSEEALKGLLLEREV